MGLSCRSLQVVGAWRLSEFGGSVVVARSWLVVRGEMDGSGAKGSGIAGNCDLGASCVARVCGRDGSVSVVWQVGQGCCHT